MSERANDSDLEWWMERLISADDECMENESKLDKKSRKPKHEQVQATKLDFKSNESNIYTWIRR